MAAWADAALSPHAAARDAGQAVAGIAPAFGRRGVGVVGRGWAPVGGSCTIEWRGLFIS